MPADDGVVAAVDRKWLCCSNQRHLNSSCSCKELSNTMNSAQMEPHGVAIPKNARTAVCCGGKNAHLNTIMNHDQSWSICTDNKTKLIEDKCNMNSMHVTKSYSSTKGYGAASCVSVTRVSSSRVAIIHDMTSLENMPGVCIHTDRLTRSNPQLYNAANKYIWS